MSALKPVKERQQHCLQEADEYSPNIAHDKTLCVNQQVWVARAIPPRVAEAARSQIESG